MNSDQKPFMTMEQRVWLGMACLIKALKPAVLYLVFPSILLMFGKMFRRTEMTTSEFIQTSGNFYYAVGTLGTFYILHRTAKKRESSVFKEISLDFKKISYKKLFYISVAGFFTGIILSLSLTMLSMVGITLGGYREISTQVFRGRDLILLFFTIGISAPLVEEIIFRGYMNRQLKMGYSGRTAAMISSAVFALFHISLVWICYSFVLALFLSYLAEKEKNTIFPLGFHVGVNLSSIILWSMTEIINKCY